MVRLALALLLLAGPAAADEFTAAQRAEIVAVLRDALQKDPTILRDATAAVQADDARVQAEAGRRLVAKVRDQLIEPIDPVEGNPLGDATLVVFYDTRCPYCRRMSPALETLLKTDPGVRIVWKDLPILGPASTLESRALLAAQRQGGYFPMQAAILTAPPGNRDTLRALADRLGLNGGAVLRDMDDPLISARIARTKDLAAALELQGTPAIVGGGQLVPGAMEIGDLRQLVADIRAGK